MRRCQRSPLPCAQHAIRPLPIRYPRTTRPSGQNTMKLTIVNPIQAGLPMSSRCAARFMIAPDVNVCNIYIDRTAPEPVKAIALLLRLLGRGEQAEAT